MWSGALRPGRTKTVVFGAAALALMVLGQRLPALWFTVIVVANTALATYYRNRS